MATHRKKSAKKRIRTGEFAVAAFLGLAVAAAPAVATADTSDGPSTGPSSDKGSTSSSSGVKTGPKTAKSGKTSAGNGSPLRTQEAAAEEDEDKVTLSGEDGGEHAEVPVGEDTEVPAGEATEVAETGTETETDDGSGAGAGEEAPSVSETGAGTGVGSEVVEPPAEPQSTQPLVTETDPAIVEPEVIETPAAPDANPVVDVIEISSSDQSASSLALKGSDPSPTPTALASALLDIDLDIVPKPPAIPAFAPFMGFINFVGSFIEQLLPAYPDSPILNPTQVAGGWVTTLFAAVQSTYVGGEPTLFTFGAYVLMTAAYQRYERLATNHLPDEPTISAGPLPLTWKLTSVDPDGDLLVYSVDLSGQPGNGLITMSPDGTFSFIPSSLTDLNEGTDVTFTVRVNDGLGMLEHPINPEGNDAFYTVSFRYPGLGINNLPVFTAPGQATVVGTDGTTGKVTISAHATDADGDQLTYTATSLFGTVTRNEDGTFTYTPNDAARHAAAGDLAAALGLNKDLVSIWANDGRGGITLLPTTVTVDILGANNAPTVTVNPPAISDPLTGLIAGGFDIDDDDNDLVTFSPGLLTTGRGGLVTVTGLGYTYLPSLQARAQGGTDTFTVTADDGHGGTVQVSITVTIAQINVAPVFETNPTITHTDHTTGVLTGTFQVRDDNGDTLTFTSAGVLGTIAVDPTPAADGVTYTFTYTPYNPHAASLPLAVTTDLVTITAWDGGLLSGDSATFLVQLSTQVNQTPSATYQNTGGSSLLGTVTGTIVTTDDDLIHTYTPLVITTDKGSVLVSGLTGDYIYTASIEARNAASASGASASDKIDTFTITVTDPAGAGVDVLVTVTIPQWNLPPAGGVASNIIADSNGVVRGQIAGVINLDDDPLTYSITGFNGASTAYTDGGGIAHVNADGSYVYVPRLGGALGYYDSFSVTVDDGRGGTTNVLVGLGAVIAPTPSLDGVTVTKTNGAPGVVTGTVGLGSSANNGLFSSFTGSGASHGTVTFDGVTYTYTRTSTGHVGGSSDTFDIIGTAYGLTIKVATVTVTPIIVNTAPAPGASTITESDVTNVLGVYWQETKGAINAVDADSDALDYQTTTPLGKSTTNGGLVYVSSDGSFTYRIGKFRSYYHDAAATGASGNVANDTFSITVTDSFGASSTIVVSIPIEKLNDGPSSSVSVGGRTADALGVVRGTISGSDDDGDSLTYTLVGGTNGTASTANGGIIRFSGNSFTYIPTAGKTTDSFQVQVNDGHGGVSTATINLTGLGTPSPTTNVNTSTANVVTGQLNTAGNTGLTYSVGGQGAKGTVAVSATGAFTYTRNGALGHTQAPGDTFTIRATDADGNSVIIATVNVTPTVTNAAPVAGTTVFTGSSIEDNRILGIGTLKQTATGTLKATDADGDTVTFTAGSFSTANGGTVVVNVNGTFTYTIDEGFSYYHGAAKIGASGSAVADSFSATAVDGFGGSTSYSVSVAIYAINKTPTISGGTKIFGNITGINVDDDDGDSLTFSHNGSRFTFGGRGVYLSTLSSGSQLTVTDGYYVTVNGVITGSPSTVTKSW